MSYFNGTHWDFTWENGRRLATAKKGTTSLSFQYNDEGIRTSKTVNDVEHVYHLNGSQIIMEEWGYSVLVYLYDAEGSPIGMQFRNLTYDEGEFDTFWFEKNLQGDIVAVYSSDGTKLISYVYDAWGNFTTSYHHGCTSSSPANLNPFRYRGYYYDTDLQMYYLQSRYYDPVIGRFVNFNDPAYIGISGTSFSRIVSTYCDNNPVNKKQGSVHMKEQSTTTPFPNSDSVEGGDLEGQLQILSGSKILLAVPSKSFFLGFDSDSLSNPPSWMRAKAFYVEGSIGLFDDGNGALSLAKIEVGVISARFSTCKFFDLSDDSILNPNLYAEVWCWNASANIGLGVSGKAVIASGEIGVELGDSVAISLGGYVGVGFVLDFSKGIRFGGGVGLGWEVNIEFDWLELFG